MASDVVQVKVTKVFEGKVDVGDLPWNALTFLLEEDSGEHDVNVYELGLDEVENTVEVKAPLAEKGDK